MADDIPAGWYPDAHGTIRWWDGQRWTDHVREGSSPAPAPAPKLVEPTVTETVVAPAVTATPEVVAPAPVTSSAATPSWASGSTHANTTVFPARTEQTEPAHTGPALDIHRPTPRVSYPKTVEDEIEEDDESGGRRVWLVTTAIALATFFLGWGLGGQTVQPRQATDPLPPAVGTEPADIEALRQQLADRQAELDERQQVLDEREAELDDRASSPSPSPSTDTPTPTASPSATATTIEGDDTVLIGTDVREGTYKTNGPADADFECEYTVSRDEFGDDVISEDTATAATSVTLRNGDWFESDDCQDWERD